MKKIALLLLILPFISYSQISLSAKMGQTSLEELQMEFYDKDSSAVAVVLYDQGNLFIYNNDLSQLRTDYYFRIKILKKEGFDKATIRIPYYKNTKSQEIKNISAITYNLDNGSIVKSELSEGNINKKELNSTWREISFALPNVRVGSVIEYSFTKINHNFLDVDDWYFQDDIPKVKSEYNSSVVGNYKYNVKLNGYFKLSKNSPSIKKRCVSFINDGYSELHGDCNVLFFQMIDVSAFKKEDYLTSKENFISKITFELESITHFSGKKNEYTNSWKAVDRKYKSGVIFGSELNKDSFFKRNLPEAILNEKDKLTRAKKIYYYVQNEITNNGNGYNFQKINTKKAFEEKTGTEADINMSLYNALKAGDIEAKLVLISTRGNGEPTKLYPVLNEFNYMIVKVSINDKDYYIDASDKELTFGLPSFKSLNGDGRIMDFKEGSYWQDIVPSINTSTNILINVKIDNNGTINNRSRIVKKGYHAQILRKELNTISEKKYLENYESKNDFIIDDYSVKGLSNTENQITQAFNFKIKNDSLTSSKLYLDLFFYDKITSNPFKLESRFYPVNFGYKFSDSYRANITLPENYTVIDLPKSKAFSLPNNGGEFIFNCKKIDNKIIVLFKYQFNKVQYTNEEYFALKEFFNQIIKTQSTLITLEKIK